MKSRSMSDRSLGKRRTRENRAPTRSTQHVALLVAHREVIAGAVLKLRTRSGARDRHRIVARGMTATSGRQLRSCEGRMEIHQGHDSEKQHGRPTRTCDVGGEPERPDCDAAKAAANPIAHAGPRQIRMLDASVARREARPGPKSRRGYQPAERSGEESGGTNALLLRLVEPVSSPLGRRQRRVPCHDGRKWRKGIPDQPFC